MSAQHTPWTYTRNPENSRWIIDSEPHHAIACTAGYACDDEGVARLIAAAPELLEFAQWIAANYENGHMNHVDFRVEAKHRADAAIAKTTGAA